MWIIKYIIHFVSIYPVSEHSKSVMYPCSVQGESTQRCFSQDTHVIDFTIYSYTWQMVLHWRNGCTWGSAPRLHCICKTWGREQRVKSPTGSTDNTGWRGWWWVAAKQTAGSTMRVRAWSDFIAPPIELRLRARRWVVWRALPECLAWTCFAHK